MRRRAESACPLPRRPSPASARAPPPVRHRLDALALRSFSERPGESAGFERTISLRPRAYRSPLHPHRPQRFLQKHHLWRPCRQPPLDRLLN
eukprot:3587006-Pleurochrysis_carterae.AAC.1